MPEQIDRYEILDELGQGAMGVVYKARDPQLERIVAIKTVREDLGLPPQAYAELRQRFYQEASAAGRLNHPNIVAIYDVKEVDGTPYIVMEYVESGRSLEDVMRAEAPLGPARAVELIAQVCGALGYAHARGVVHRDIKPGNILITGSGAVKVSDFGIARIAGRKLTQTGVKLGTPSYMSPEQARGRDVDSRSDLFSLGVIFYEALTGADAFPGDDTDAVLYQIVHEPVTPLRERQRSIPPALEAVVHRALAKDPQQRYLTAAALADAAQQALGGIGAAGKNGAVAGSLLGLARRPAVLIGAGSLVVAIAVIVAFVPWPGSPPRPDKESGARTASPIRPADPGPKPDQGTGGRPSATGEGRPAESLPAVTSPTPSPRQPSGAVSPPNVSQEPRPAPAPRLEPGGGARSEPPPIARAAPEPPDVAPLPDEVRRRVVATLRASSNFRQVEVQVDRGLNVDLLGTVPDESSASTALRLTRSVRGVRSATSYLVAASAMPPPVPPPAPPIPALTSPAPPPPRFSTPAPPTPAPPPRVATPAEVERNVQAALRSSHPGVSVSVDAEHNVRLAGMAPNEQSRQAAMRIARGVPDVRDVRGDAIRTSGQITGEFK